MFIAFDGLDGSGKTTLSEMTYDYLKSCYEDVFLYNMGSLGFIDEVMLDIKNKKIQCDSEIRELLYYFEGNLFSKFIAKNVIGDKKHHIIIDRYVLSYLSYGPLNGLEAEQIKLLTNTMVLPDIYFYIDIDPETALQRISSYRKIDNPEIGFKNNLSITDEDQNKKQFIQHQKKVKQNYKDSINSFDGNIKIIDGNKPVKSIFSEIKCDISKIL